MRVLALAVLVAPNEIRRLWRVSPLRKPLLSRETGKPPEDKVTP